VGCGNEANVYANRFRTTKSFKLTFLQSAQQLRLQLETDVANFIQKPNGNGRMARFLMNVMLASGGYPWTVIRLRDRKSYLAALDSASIDMEIKPFAALVGRRVRWSLERHELQFPKKVEKFDLDRQVVAFFGQDGKTRVRCAISREALDDDFGADNSDEIEAFRENRKTIEEWARQKYAAGDTEADGAILIRSGELARRRG
jgi:hypothetical protein